MTAAQPLGEGGEGFHEDGTLEAVRLAALLRRGFRQAQLLMTRSLGEHDLSALQYHLLLEVGAAGGAGIVQGHLAELMQCPETRISTLVRELGDRRLLSTLRAPPDRRVVRIGLTREGSRVLNAALHSQREALNTLSGYLALPNMMALVEAALRLYLGVEVTLQVPQPGGQDARGAH